MYRNESLGRVEHLLIETGVITPVAASLDARSWSGVELSLLVEGHFNQIVDANALSAAERRDWEIRLDYRPDDFPSQSDDYRHLYWLWEGDHRVGILAFFSHLVGLNAVQIDTLYVQPEARRRGVATRTLEAVYAAALQSGASGVAIATSWCWRRAVAFYLNCGLWVANWKHSVVFCRRPNLGAYAVQIDGTKAQFTVLSNDHRTLLLQAENCGDFLRLSDPFPFSERGLEDAGHRAYGTFALHLAVQGWPLIRSAALWEQRYHHSDMGMPEGLAYKIAVFEDEARRRGFESTSPTIPGLDYACS